MRKLIRTMALALVATCLLAGCGDDDGGSATTQPAESTTTNPTPTESPTTTSAQSITPVSVYLLHGETLRVGYGREAVGLGVAATAVEALLEGPNTDDESLGLSTAIPEGTELLGLNIVDDLATVDLSSEFEAGGGTLSMNARLAQVVYTATQFPSVRSVVFHLEGEPLTTLGGEGLLIDEPLTRSDFEFGGDYEVLAPSILVETPRPGSEVDGSIRLAGRSNTFEATFSFEVVDTDGEVVVEEGFGTATSGTGTPGDFDVTIDLPADSPDQVVLLVFENSAQDGSRMGVVEVPLRIGS